jgi:hypothetical protein
MRRRAPDGDLSAVLRAAAFPAALSAAFLALWLSLPDHVFVFDGVMFAEVVERASEDWRQELLNPRHLLFNGLFQMLRDALGVAGVKVGAYRLFQIVNAFAGAAGLFLLGDAARRLSRDAAFGWCAALLLGATLGYGTRATEGQVYMLMSLGAIAVLWSSVRLLEKPTIGRAAALILAAGVSALIHAADAFLLPAAAAALWLAYPKRRAGAAAGAAAAGAVLVVPYLFVFGRVGLRGFVGGATDFHASAGGDFLSGVFARLWGADGIAPISRAVKVWRETGLTVTSMPGGAAAAAGLSLWGAAGWASWDAWPRLDGWRRASAAAIVLAWAGFTVVNAFWPGGTFFYVPAHACALLLLSVWIGARPATAASARRKALGGLVFAGAALGVWNAVAGLLPQSRIENNFGYRAAMFVGAHTEASSLVVISGLGFENSKVYLPFFAHRSRDVLEYYFDRWPKPKALELLGEFSGRLSECGVPMYFLSDVVESLAVADQMKRAWGVELPDLVRAFGSGRMLKIAASPEERVYLFVPQARQAELFAVLGYSALTGNEQTRLGESAAALKEIAQGMSAAEKRRAAGLLRSTNWGFDLLWKGFSVYMSPESKSQTLERGKKFAAYAQTAEFWLRAGNLYELLGLKAETLDAWARAQKLSGDAALLRRVEALRRSR